MALDDTPGATAGSEGAAAPQITDERSAVAALEGLLDTGAIDTESGAPAPDAGPDERPATGDGEEGQPEPAEGEESETPAIEPPQSWSADDKAVFGTLPPEAQAVIARRESERDKLIGQRTQEIAEQRKAHEAERTAIQTERQTYAQSLQQMMLLAVPEAKKFAEMTDADWLQLSREKPAEWASLSAERDVLRNRVGAVQAELQRVNEQTIRDQQQHFGEFRVEQQQKLVEKIPEFGDAEKGKKLAGELRTWLQDQGFSEQEIGQAVDHRLIFIATKAMRADQAETARKAAEAKRANPAPTVQRPGSKQGSDSAVAQRVEGKYQQLRKTGRDTDAASLILELIR